MVIVALVLATSTSAESQTNKAPVKRTLTVRLETVELSGSGPFWAMFGAAPKRTLNVVMVNTGSAAIRGIIMVISSRARKSILSPFELAPGEQRQITSPVRFGAMAFGTQSVHVSLSAISTGGLVQGTAKSSTYPWGLIVLMLAVVAAVSWAAVRKLTARPEVREARDSAVA